MINIDKPKIVFLLPSYKDDLQYVTRLITSYKKYNVDNIKLYLVVDKCDYDLFVNFQDDNIVITTKETIAGDYLVHDNSIHGIRSGYINQSIVKLSFWEQSLCDNYFCIDSDGVFIRDFYISDFIYNDNTPYTILVEDHELQVEPEYYNKYWVGREKFIRIIQKEIGLKDARMLTCHGFAILSCEVLKSMKENFMTTKKRGYKDLLKISPYEFSWYNMWLQKDKTIDIQIKEPLFKTFHQRTHHIEYLRKKITLKDIARGYMGVVVNSNYSRWYGIVSYEDGNISPFKFYKKIKMFIEKKIKIFDDA